MDLFDLSGSVAIVTGGNGGIGRGIALGLAEAGADVAIAARNEEKTATVVAEIKALGRRAVGIRCDVAKKTDIEAAVASTTANLGTPGILVANSGIALGTRPEALPEEDWDRVLDTNLKGVFLFSQAVYAGMKALGGGKIITIGSMYSIFGGAQSAPYGASKGGVVQLTRSLAVAWAPDNIQVNCILPGWIVTEMTGWGGRERRHFSERIVARTPAGRWGEAEELAGAGVFLASRASDFVTGISLPVDGGWAVMG
ncbi:MAG: glucose 1-dehydrogenase [Dehalococcoidia bacterium]|nr:glucose 1-dehydrogenase [Dehalococcoidia bacterium]